MAAEKSPSRNDFALTLNALPPAMISFADPEWIR